MKKLMVTLAAVATAFGLYAADAGFKSGSAFETGDGGTAITDTTYWTIPEGSTATVIEGKNGLSEDYFPLHFSKAADENVLKIKTDLADATKAIVLNVNASAAKQDIDKGLYFDGLVNLTAFDDDAEIPDDAKIAVWLKESLNDQDEVTARNLVITAGKDGAKFNYVTAENVSEGWHRLTIKAIANIYAKGAEASSAGFVVFVDNHKVGFKVADKWTPAATLDPNAQQFYNDGALFPALATGDQITSISFAGQGSVDEVVFTTTAPSFAEDYILYQVTWDDTIESVKVGGESVEKGAWYEVKDGAKTFAYTAADGYISDSTNITGVAGETYTLTAKPLAATVIINGKAEKFADFGEALDAAQGAAGSTLMLGTDLEAGIQITTGDFIIDLAGKKITATDDDQAAIYVLAGAVTITNSTDKIGVVAGVEAEAAVDYDNGDVTITAGAFDGEAYATEITGGFFSDPDNTEELADGKLFAEEATTIEDVEYYEVIDYVAPTYAVTWDESAANATVEAMVDGRKIESGDKFEAETKIDFTVSPIENYEYATAPEGWTLEEDGTITKTEMVAEEDVVVTIPAATEKKSGPTSDQGTIGEADASTGIAVFAPTDPTTTEVTVDLGDFTGKVAFSNGIEKITGIPANQIVILNSKGHAIDATALVGGDEGGFSTALTDAAQKPAFATTTEGETAEKPFVVGDENVALGVQTINGLIYQLQSEAELNTKWNAVGDPVEGNGQPMTFTADKTDAPAQFYSIKVSK